ncbi:MAG TPA: lactonase family protein [Terracidiphilus sp.]|nr:lactonase family protein [Terracidiphilus sp.]
MTTEHSPLHPTRRSLLRASPVLALAPALPAFARAAALHAPSFAFVGTYDNAPGAPGNGQGIYRFKLDPHTGGLMDRTLVAQTPNPSWIAIHPTRRLLFCVNEVTNFEGDSGAASAFALSPATGSLRQINTVNSHGTTPAFLSIDPRGRFVFVADYGSGVIAVLPILPGGALGPAVDIHHDVGSVGSTHAADAPAGSFAISGHDAPHAHMIAADPEGRFVLATDLGQDRIYTYRFDHSTGKLSPAAHPFVSLPSGDGPRHFVFHPNGRWFYSIQEEASTVAFFRYNQASGALAHQQTLSTLPPGFAGTNFASEILVSPDGRSLYAANRLHDTIAHFAIGADGRLAWVGETPTLGDYPRHCCIAPGGNFLFVCNQHSDAIAAFRIHRPNGQLQFTGQYTPVGSPSCIAFL